MDYLRRLEKVDPRLILVMLTAGFRFEMAHPGFRVRVAQFGGYRTAKTQARLVAEGKSSAERSYHQDGLAVDLAIIDLAKVVMVDDLKVYKKLDDHVQTVADEFDLHVTWGGNWAIRDGVHWQLEVPRRDDGAL